MKWYWYVIFILFAAVVSIWYIYSARIEVKEAEVKVLNARISLLEAHRDTLYLPGKVDTVYKTKVLQKASNVATKEMKVDTAIVYPNGSWISIYSEDVSKGLDIFANLIEREVEVLRVDTVKISVPKFLEVKTEVKRPFYDNFEIGMFTGIVSTLGVVYVVTKMIR